MTSKIVSITARHCNRKGVEFFILSLQKTTKARILPTVPKIQKHPRIEYIISSYSKHCVDVASVYDLAVVFPANVAVELFIFA